jgi:hypothetical protein
MDDTGKGPGFGFTTTQLDEMGRAFRDASQAFAALVKIAENSPALQAMAESLASLAEGFEKIAAVHEEAAKDATEQDEAEIQAARETIQRLQERFPSLAPPPVVPV